jgi:lysophospholipase L1-like esterase
VTKKIFAIFILLIGLIVQSKGQSAFKIPKKTKKIVFLGNSITYSGLYVAQVETYLKLKYPKNKYEFLNLGLPSETVSQLSENNHANERFPRPALQERLSRVLSQTKPDLVFANYGMNDGIYLPFDENRFQKYKDGIEWLHSKVEKTGAKIVHLTPPIYDDRKGKEYANVLDIYSNWLLSKKADNWQVADMHFVMKEFVQNKRLLDSTFTLAKDGIHPNDTGHWIMAKALLTFLGENEVAQFSNANEVFEKYKNGQEIAALIKERQVIFKDSWLNETGHKRPEMPKGLPLIDAQKKAEIITNQVKMLLN